MTGEQYKGHLSSQDIGLIREVLEESLQKSRAFLEPSVEQDRQRFLITSFQIGLSNRDKLRLALSIYDRLNSDPANIDRLRTGPRSEWPKEHKLIMELINSSKH